MHTSVRVLVPSPLMILFRVITTPPHVGHQFAYAISVYPLRWRTSAASCCSVIASRLSSKSGVRRFPNFAPLLIHDFINRSADWFASAMFMSLTSMLATSGQLATVTYPVQRIGDKSEWSSSVIVNSGQRRISWESAATKKQLFLRKPQWELKSPDAPSAKLLQLSGTTYRSIHAPLLHTNDSYLRQRNIFTNWLSWTDHVTVSAPTIRFFPPTTYGALSNTYNNNNTYYAADRYKTLIISTGVNNKDWRQFGCARRRDTCSLLFSGRCRYDILTDWKPPCKNRVCWKFAMLSRLKRPAQLQ